MAAAEGGSTASGSGPLVECVPNLSEGRDPEVIAALRAAAAAVEGVKLLDSHSDRDHNRTVLTFAGPPAQVTLAAMRLAREAVRRIDMRNHAGVHPRMGAVDVMPFVPLRDISLDACAAIAREVGRYIGKELDVPVFLYGAAASPGHPRSLRDIRGNGHQSIDAMAAGFRSPDFGPESPHPTAGATAVGARGPLIAVNVNLDTDDLAVAERIARAMRASSGGPPQVQALAFPLADQGRAQVSMNLLDYRVTGLAEVLALIRRLCAESGVRPGRVELVGLVPAAALEGLSGDELPGVPGPADSIEARLEGPGLA
ncbi:MAG TPA: glutamate formimidoyltransferase [Candidatus Solibacter sp.]|jgi:glutamate formiminotransferase|nr:glutamate formimidoyltransferase [Candidatus Solibacter sp.]